MIFPDTNVVSETLKRTPDAAVASWLARFDVELALSMVAIAEVSYGIAKIRPDQRSRRLAAQDPLGRQLQDEQITAVEGEVGDCREP